MSQARQAGRSVVGRHARRIAALAVGAAAIGAARNAGAGAREIQYEARASADASELSVEANVPAGVGSSFRVDPDASAFIAQVTRADGDRWLPMSAGRDGWRARGCERTGCRIRYTFHLAAAARALADPDTAVFRGHALVGPVSTWLLRPSQESDGVRADGVRAEGVRGRLHVTIAPPLAFVSGLAPVAGAPDTYSVALLPFFVSPYSAFGRFEVETLSIGGARLELAVAAPDLTADRPRIRGWTIAAARAVSRYFGRFPVERALLLAVPQSTGMHGKALGGGGASVLLQIARGTDLGDPDVEWQAAHEMVHLAVPEMSRAQIWLTEGLATYVEPLARSMTGELRPETVWRDLVDGLPKGEPAAGDEGLDHTHTWGRTYWGGAMFAFLADLEIRKASHGEQSLATALRGVLRDGGDVRVFWPVQRFLAACDRALGRPIVSDLYRRMADRPVDVDLPAIWRELGVGVSNQQVTFDDSAPLAPLRRRMIGPS